VNQMGDMADYALDQVWDMEDARSDYWAGDITNEEAYDMGIVDEMGGYCGPARSSTPKTCKHCGQHGLRWVTRDDRWRLADNTGKLHVCKEHTFPNEERPVPVSDIKVGTVPARFQFLLNELDRRLGPIDQYSSQPPELELLRRLDEALAWSGE
jgi:hypothetical protein